MTELEWVEETPNRIRRGPTGRAWEVEILPRLEQSPGTTYRLFTFPARQPAVNRNQHIRKRLKETNPDVVVECAVDEYEPGKFGSYITYIGREA